MAMNLLKEANMDRRAAIGTIVGSIVACGSDLVENTQKDIIDDVIADRDYFVNIKCYDVDETELEEKLRIIEDAALIYVLGRQEGTRDLSSLKKRVSGIFPKAIFDESDKCKLTIRLVS